MGHAIAPFAPPPARQLRPVPPAAPPRPPADFRFHNLVLSDPTSIWRGRTATLALSITLHAVFLAAMIVVPLLVMEDYLPAPGEGLRAFFVSPPDVAPPPPPPPPPPAGARAVARAPVPPRPAEPARFVAPVEIPEAIAPEESLDLGGLEGGVPGGVEGGVPGGVVGGIVGGLPTEAPAPPPKVVRIGGQIMAPKLIHRVDPEYPELARQARLQAMVIMEAWVGVDGRVKSVKVLRGALLLDEPAMAAVRQWRYRPLLLNGQATEFLLTVTVSFRIVAQEP
jgi:periplasmic protein TonB